MSNTAKELGFGFCGGLVGQTLCHPFDTVKTRLQESKTYSLKQDLRTNGLMTLYRGLPSPLTSVIIEKSLLFSSYDFFRSSSLHLGSFSSGIMAGIITTLTVTPFERVKVNSQILNKATIPTFLDIIKKDGVVSLYRGWTATLFREVPGYGLYFAAYEAVKNLDNGTITPIRSFFTGSFCGVVAWTFIYPSDPVKTVMQFRNCSAQSAIKDIWHRAGIRGFYRGFTWGIARAAILHGGVFLGYETSKKLATNLKH